MSFKKVLLTIVFFLMLSLQAFSQVAINNDGSQATSYTILDVKSDTAGLLIPRMTTAQRNALANKLNSDHKGMLVFDKTGGYMFVWTGTEFKALNTGNINKIQDEDNDTYVDVEGDADADEIVFSTGGNINWTLKNGRIETINTGYSVFIGENAGENDDLSNNNNVFIGYNAGEDNATGDYNIAIGNYALQNNNSGSNTAIGNSSLKYNTSGSVNTAVGESTLHSNTTGYSNTAIGTYSMYYNETGIKNTGLGFRADFYNRDGDGNTIIGYEAGRGITSHTKHRNIFIGYQAGYNEAGSDKLYIENSSSTTPLIGGDFSTNQVEINGTIKITGGTPGENKILSSDTNGVASWSSLSEVGGVTALNDLTDATTDATSLFIGGGSGANNDGSDNYNVALGVSALVLNTTGNRNHAIGYHALNTNTTGSGNFAVGIGALQTNTDGSNNIALGNEAMETLEDGSNNIAIGIASMYNGTISSGNTMLGYQTGYYNTSGDNNVFIGYQAGYNESGSNKLYIDNSNTASPLIYGDFDTDQLGFIGDVGIGTKTPQTFLHVMGSETYSSILISPSTSGSGGDSEIQFAEDSDNTYGMAMRYDGNDNRLFFYGKSDLVISDPLFTIERGGNVGIGTSNPSELFEVVSTRNIRTASFTGGGLGTANATVYSNNTSTSGIAGYFQSAGSDGTVVIKQNGSGEIIKAYGSSAVDEVWNVSKDGTMEFYNSDGIRTIEIDPSEIGSSDAGQIRLFSADGATVNIEIDGSYNGDGRVITNEIQITGGSDLSEFFELSEYSNIEKGMVVSIDENNPGQLKITETAFDKKVAGIVSGANQIKPGLIMSQKGTIADGEHLIALSGRVYCLVDASEKPVEIGDMLTTSSIPGHAIKVDDYDKARGAIIGKAMTPLEKGKGLVLVLVSLQ